MLTPFGRIVPRPGEESDKMRANQPTNRRRRGAASVEYVLVLALVVIPLALLTPLILRMITAYSGRFFWSIALPFG